MLCDIRYKVDCVIAYWRGGAPTWMCVYKQMFVCKAAHQRLNIWLVVVPTGLQQWHPLTSSNQAHSQCWLIYRARTPITNRVLILHPALKRGNSRTHISIYSALTYNELTYRIKEKLTRLMSWWTTLGMIMSIRTQGAVLQLYNLIDFPNGVITKWHMMYLALSCFPSPRCSLHRNPKSTTRVSVI